MAFLGNRDVLGDGFEIMAVISIAAVTEGKRRKRLSDLTMLDAVSAVAG